MDGQGVLGKSCGTLMKRLEDGGYNNHAMQMKHWYFGAMKRLSDGMRRLHEILEHKP